VQTNPDIMNEAMREAGYALADTMDQFMAAKWSEAANNIGSNASPKTDLNTAANAYVYMLQMSTLLDEANIPSQGRWLIIPPWFKEILMQDARFINPGTAQAEQRLANNVVGQIAGFTLLQSNNVVNTSNDNYKILAGHPIAWTLAEQIVKVEAYRLEKRFADAVKGLHVYGAKVVRPAALVCLHADRP
jgi:N4-gp56 family major capsid protein